MVVSDESSVLCAENNITASHASASARIAVASQGGNEPIRK